MLVLAGATFGFIGTILVLPERTFIRRDASLVPRGRARRHPLPAESPTATPACYIAQPVRIIRGYATRVSMKCERCDNVAVEHVAICEGGKVRELHLCEACANADAGMTGDRQRALQNRP